MPEGFKAFEASEKSLDEWFETLKDSRSSIRSMASMKIAELHDKDGKVRSPLVQASEACAKHWRVFILLRCACLALRRLALVGLCRGMR